MAASIIRRSERLGSWLLALVLVLMAMFPAGAYSQNTTADIFGLVTDTSGAVAAGATVVVTESRTGYRREVRTNGEGTYSAPRLQTGTYTIEVRLAGFSTARQTNIVLDAGDRREINVQLKVGAVSEVVDVVASLPTVETTSGVVRTSIDDVLVDRIPILGRNANNLIALVPGMTTGVQGDFASNGVRENSNSFRLDGTDNLDVFKSVAGRNPPPDSLQEFTIQTNYSAEFGHGGGAAVLAVTKSGTNQWHGSAYDYFQTSGWNANSWERNAQGLPRGALKQHQWGGSFGGPVIVPHLYDGRNKTFFFVNIQRLWAPSTAYLYHPGGLTAAELAGDFSQSAKVPVVSTSAANAPNSPFKGLAGQKITNLVPFLSPTAVKWYKLLGFPTVAVSGDNPVQSLNQAQDQPDYVVRLDQVLNHNNKVSASGYYFMNFPDPKQVDNAPLGFAQGNKLRDRHLSIVNVTTIGSTLVNEAAFGFTKIAQTQVANFGNADFASLGLAYPQLPNSFVGFNKLTPSQFGLNSPSFKDEVRSVTDFRDTVSFVKGRHLMKTGGAFQYQRIQQLIASNQNYLYNGQWLGNSAAEFLIGWPASFGSIQAPSNRNARIHYIDAFFQDDWKLRPNLTLNFGLRWEPHFWGHLTSDSALIFIPGAKSRFANFPSGTILTSDSASPNLSGQENDIYNFAPRVGVAYKLDSAGKMVLRGGWGLFFDATNGVHDGIDLNSDAFLQSFGTSFNLGYPGPEGWLDIFKYANLPVPNFSDLVKKIDPSQRVFNPNSGSPGIYKPGLELGYVHQYNVTFEHEFHPGWSYSVAYLGTQGVKLWGLDFWNLPVHKDSTDSWDNANLASRRPDQTYRLTDKAFIAANGSSSYNAFQVTVKARGRGPFHMLSHYTYSRAYSNIDGEFSKGDANGYGRGDPNNLDADWSPSVMDIPHRLVFAPSWESPYGKGRHDLIGLLVSNWSLTPVLTIQNGRLVNVLAAQNNSFICDNSKQCWERPNATGAPLINPNWETDPKHIYVNAAAFSQPADGTFGNLPRNAIRWPYTKNVDMSVRRAIPVTERAHFELQLDAFNLFNNVNFKQPNAIKPSDPSTLNLLSQGTLGPRRMQAALRFIF